MGGRRRFDGIIATQKPPDAAKTKATCRCQCAYCLSSPGATVRGSGLSVLPEDLRGVM